MKQLLKCVLKENKWNILSASLILGMYTILRLFPGAIMEKFINLLSSNSGNSRSLVFFAVFYMISALLLYILEIGKNYCSRKAAWRMTDVLRVSLLANIIKKGQHFYNRYGTGEMIEHLGGDSSVLESFVSTTMVPVLIDILSLLSILIIFFYTNVILGLCFTLFCVMVFTLLFFVQKMDSDSVVEEREARTNLTAFFAEVITLRKEIKLMCKTKNIFDRINAMMAALKQQQIRKQKYLYRRKYSLERFFHSYEGYGIEEKLNQVVNPERLSIGERQILNMLRLFFSEKRIVIFDEAIANVDPDVEDDFFGIFDLASAQHTTIIITHNVERLVKCDKIVALERGKVAEYGTSIDLANNLNSMYSRYSKKRWEQ